MKKPKVSILVAARNEESNILHTLQSLEQLNYPKSDYEVLIGNDASEDNTAQIVSDFIKEKPYFQLYNIGQNLPALKGKANVLAQLAQKANGKYLFFTDADTVVPSSWINSILPSFKNNVGVVTGITTMKGWKALAQFQALEWLLALSIMRIMSLFSIPLTGMGNNMAVSKEAYLKVGGFEKIGFSIVEDYALFNAIVTEGYKFVQLFDNRVMAITNPIETYKALLIQRKRWVKGAMTLPLAQKINFYTNGLLLPLIIIGLYFKSKLIIGFSVFHFVFITGLLAGSLSWLNINQLFLFLPLFWFYHLFTNFAMLFNYIFTKDTYWKGRKY